ncbi:MAG: hypothetical protein K6G44_14335 [Lentisphaeria bacterium]|nr:hypothetical protein [Lentisphaeria bacterium]
MNAHKSPSGRRHSPEGSCGVAAASRRRTWATPANYDAKAWRLRHTSPEGAIV